MDADREDDIKMIADKVYGTRFALSNDRAILVVKFDLGSYRRAFHFSAKAARYMMSNISTLNGRILGLQPTAPELHPEDWDGLKTHFVTKTEIHEFENGLVLDLTLRGGQRATFLLDQPNWKFFMDNLWQYRPYLDREDTGDN